MDASAIGIHLKSGMAKDALNYRVDRRTSNAEQGFSRGLFFGEVRCCPLANKECSKNGKAGVAALMIFIKMTRMTKARRPLPGPEQAKVPQAGRSSTLS